MKYWIYSPSKGVYAGFHQGKHLWDRTGKSLWNDFNSRSGAEATIEIMSALDAETTPADMTVVNIVPEIS